MKKTLLAVSLLVSSLVVASDAPAAPATQTLKDRFVGYAASAKDGVVNAAGYAKTNLTNRYVLGGVAAVVVAVVAYKYITSHKKAKSTKAAF